ncbi:hypothetical protein AKJ59_00590 [candidate division MSBL1 archaeon SCGC-AAA385M02]|uniref:Uncharacterized protein n=1 Tax=candidate division MSBL1 archaeon SCGC-AAA385M02 TaxID=1698287 RepID=A0A133VQK1_9EURY|nr:hypothetical protein AKJ59_00590 [candidate division MSBL1 archaeon SCGC-AAA385M02]
MAEINSLKDLILAGWGGYEGWGETEALADFRATGGVGKKDPSVAMRLYPNEVSPELSTAALEEEIANIVIELDEKLSEIPIVLTDEEKEQFLQDAIDQITPYYDEKKEEIEAGIKEGEIRTAEDILSEIRKVRQDTEQQLKKYKVWEAETEEEFVNTMADITATEEEDLEMKRADWRDRVRETRRGQIETGVLTSGIGRKRIGEMQERKRMETGAIQRRAGQARTEAETAKKYDVKKITLAREAAKSEAERLIGTEKEQRQTIAKMAEQMGLKMGPPEQQAPEYLEMPEDIGEHPGYARMDETQPTTEQVPWVKRKGPASLQAPYEVSRGELYGLDWLPSEAAIQARRGAFGGTIYKPGALTELARERKEAIESRRGELETQEEAIRKQKRKQLKKKILADLAKKKKYMGAPILKSYLATV